MTSARGKSINTLYGNFSENIEDDIQIDHIKCSKKKCELQISYGNNVLDNKKTRQYFPSKKESTLSYNIKKKSNIKQYFGSKTSYSKNKFVNNLSANIKKNIKKIDLLT